MTARLGLADICQHGINGRFLVQLNRRSIGPKVGEGATAPAGFKRSDRPDFARKRKFNRSTGGTRLPGDPAPSLGGRAAPSAAHGVAVAAAITVKPAKRDQLVERRRANGELGQHGTMPPALAIAAGPARIGAAASTRLGIEPRRRRHLTSAGPRRPL